MECFGFFVSKTLSTRWIDAQAWKVPPLHLQKILQHLLPVLAEDGLGVELDAVDGQFAVSEVHNFAFGGFASASLHSTTCQFPPLAAPIRRRRLVCLSWRICFSTARVLMPKISAICGMEILGDLRAIAMILPLVFPELFPELFFAFGPFEVLAR